MKLQAQLQQVVAGIERLAEAYAKHCPDCRTISIRRADWNAIIAHPDEARIFGFTVTDESVTYHGFALSPTDCGASHNKST